MLPLKSRAKSPGCASTKEIRTSLSETVTESSGVIFFASNLIQSSMSADSAMVCSIGGIQICALRMAIPFLNFTV